MWQPFVVDFNPVAFGIGPFDLPWLGELHPQIHWYGLMYLAGFLAAWILGKRRCRLGGLPVNSHAFGDLMFYAMLGVIVGGRVWYMRSYQSLSWIWAQPLALLRIWDGGMSFHGGLMGVVLAAWWWSRKHGLHPFDTVDFLAPLVPIGLGLGRLGNFINGELWGKPSPMAWAMIFPNARGQDIAFAQAHPTWHELLLRYGGLPRHPSQLYEFLLEGVVMCSVLYIYSRKPRRRYAVSGLFALMYGCFRFAVEFLRMPDPQLGYLAWGWLTMGQLQSIPLLSLGALLLWLSWRQPEPCAASP